MKRVNYFLAGIMLTLAVSCVAPEEWNIKYENIVPEPVSNVEVENVNGGAIITYTLPAVKDLLGVKVAYSLTTDGELMERWSSAEKDTIVLEGYGDTNERTATIYAVHKSGNISVGVPLTIKPLTPPIFVIRETLKAEPTFGGVQVTWDNPLRKDMGLALYVEDSITHEMELFDKYFSNSVYGKNVFRHFNPVERNFLIEMFDRWQNYAESFKTTLTPMEEVEIMTRDALGNPMWSLYDQGNVSDNGVSRSKNIYRCDQVTANSTFQRVLTWNTTDNFNINASSTTLENYLLATPEEMAIPFPLYMTIDMGRKATYSRMEMLGRPRNPQYSNAIPVEMNIWGCNNPKKVDEVGDGSRQANQAYWSSWAAANGTDDWKKDWVKITHTKYLLSDGTNDYYDGMSLSSTDIDDIDNGFKFDFELETTESFRYIRWEILKTNTGNRSCYICGIKFFGQYAD